MLYRFPRTKLSFRVALSGLSARRVRVKFTRREIVAQVCWVCTMECTQVVVCGGGGAQLLTCSPGVRVCCHVGGVSQRPEGGVYGFREVDCFSGQRLKSPRLPPCSELTCEWLQHAMVRTIPTWLLPEEPSPPQIRSASTRLFEEARRSAAARTMPPSGSVSSVDRPCAQSPPSP